ncbi:hypothetical protein Tco_0867130 [Tanacetum coccineum]
MIWNKITLKKKVKQQCGIVAPRESFSLFNGDDAIFIGQWNELNIDTLVRVLECFFRASGLRINMSKSKIMGVNVEDAKVKIAANKLGCLVQKLPSLT